jgi:serine/threonine protein kinase
MSLAGGTRVEHYEIIRPLGAGGMGEVYLARDTELSRTVAVKVLPADVTSDPHRVVRFEQEARAASALNHPTCVVDR